ncbi:MAG: hypothetical protein MI919_42180, partial [Holophagales bacterium]|nr:hypothetical protein [Holophagales bacterium]
FPGDEASDYEAMIELFPALFHLKAPGQCIWVQITRFAPLAERPADFGYAAELRHHWRYDVMFSPDYLQAEGLDLASVCYSFESYNEDLIAPEVKDLYLILQQQWWQWRGRESAGCRLSYRADEDGICFLDSRMRDKPKTLEFGPVHRALYERVHTRIRKESEVVRDVPGASNGDVAGALEDLLRAQVVIAEGPRYLGLALPESVYAKGSFWWAESDSWDGFLE